MPATTFNPLENVQILGEPEKKEQPQLPPEAQAAATANHDRIQRNLQRMLNKDAAEGTDSSVLMRRYLREEEGITLGVVEEDRPQEDVSPGSIVLSMARGSVTGMTSLVTLPILAGEALGSAIRSTWTGDFELNTPFSDLIKGGGEEFNKLLDPNFSFAGGQDFDVEGRRKVESAFANRASEKIGEFVAPGGVLVKGMTNAGARLLSKSPQTLGFFKRMLYDMAKNPAKTQAYEAALGAVAATSGETAVSQVIANGNPAEMEHLGKIRFAAEMVSIVGVVGTQRIIGRFKDFALTKLAPTAAMQKEQAEVLIGKIINEIMEGDTNVLKSIRNAEDLMKAIPGLDLTTANVFQNPQIQAALTKVIQTSPNGATRYLRLLENSRQRVSKFIEEVGPIMEGSGQNVQSNVKKFVQQELDSIDTRITLAEEKALDEAAFLNPNRTPESVGESGIEQMKVLEEEAMDKLEVLYKALDPEVMYKVDRIQHSIKLARHDPRVAESNVLTEAQNQLRVAGGAKPKPLKGLVGRDFGDIDQKLVELGLQNFGPGVKRIDLPAMLEWRRTIGQHERLAGIKGDLDTQARLETLRKGVDAQLDGASKRAKTGKAAQQLKTANEAWAANKQRFDAAYARLGIQRDLATSYKFAPETFGRKFIRGEKSTAVQSAKDFQRIFGDTPAAKALIVDSVSYQLSRFKTEKGFDLRGLQGWLKDHERSLRAHGVWDQFKDSGHATLRANEVQAAGIVDRKVWNESVLKAVVDAPNIRSFITKQIKDGKLGALGAEIRAMNNGPAEKGFAGAVWDAIINKGNTGKIDTVEQIVRRPDNILAIVLEHKKDLIEGLGRTHYNSLTTIGKAVKLTEGNITTFGARATEAATTPVVNQRMLGRAFSKIRASLQGFVSPQFTLVQLANQGMDIISSRAAQVVIEEAMYDWRYAVELAKIAETRAGQRALTLIGASAIPATAAFIEEEDERTDP